MKMILFFLLSSLTAWTKSTVLIGHFDPFDGAPYNASEKVAEGLMKVWKDHRDIELVTCPLSTVFDKSFFELEACLKNLNQRPQLILGLGEYGCELKVETLGRNFDKSISPDNEGNERNGTEIIPGAESALGFTYPLPEMYCALPEGERKTINVSNNAGSFVCNNLAYQFTHAYGEVPFGFIHVPAHNCWFASLKIKRSISLLRKMIEAAVSSKSLKRFPVYKLELDALRNNPKNSCLKEFYHRSAGIDE